MTMIVIILLAIIAVLSLLFFLFQKRHWKLYGEMYDLLDDILDGKEIAVADVKEGELPAFANKARRVQEKLNLEIESANAEKEQVKSLISNMSHQLKTPLANVMMYEELLEKEADSENAKKFLGKMKAQSEKIDWILQSLFKMVKLEQNVISFDAEALPIRPTILDAVNIVYAKAAKKEIEIVLEPFEDIELFHNRKWTAEVFDNLLENAVKYSDKGSVITITVEHYEMYTAISFADQGRGIVEAELSQLCKRFYRSEEVSNIEGSGIGLYLSKMILEKEKGYLNISSEYQKGSTFSVFLQNCKK